MKKTSVCVCVCMCVCVRACVCARVHVLHVPLHELHNTLCRHEEDVSVGAFVKRRGVTVYDLCNLQYNNLVEESPAANNDIFLCAIIPNR